MARWNRVKINDTYLTTTGLAGWTLCRVKIPNLLQMRIAPRNVEEDLDGGQHVQFSDLTGFEIPMTVSSRSASALDDFIDEINDVEADGSFHNIVIEGDTGNFDVDCALVRIGNDGTFSNGIVNNIDLVFKVDTMNVYTP